MDSVELTENTISRLKYMESLTDGWFDEGQGTVINRVVLEATEKLLKYVTFHKLPEPYLFPLEDGTISVEWKKCNLPVTVDVNETHYDFAISKSGDVESQEFKFNEVSNIIKIMKDSLKT